MRILAATVLLLLLAGCAETPAPAPVAQPPSSSTPSSSAPSSSTAPAASVPTILAFKATTVDGMEFDGAKLAGKPTVFWFWAAWCPKCKGDAAAVRDVAAAVSGKANVVGVAGLGSGDAGMKGFVATYRLDSFPQLADDKGDVWKRFKVTTQHYYVILDANGGELHRGPLNIAQLREKIGA